MPLIELKTTIQAPIQRCFDLARSVDLHTISTAHTHEKAIAGRTSGLIEMDDVITWQAKHLGFTQKLSIKITAFEAPNYFVDEMTKGAFKSFQHQHLFEASTAASTLMTDRFQFESPLGLLGHLANRLFLTQYMTHFLQQRNQIIKQVAESEEWKKVLGINH